MCMFKKDRGGNRYVFREIDGQMASRQVHGQTDNKKDRIDR